MNRKTESNDCESWISTACYVMVALTSLTFVINVNDGTFLKAPLMYSSCAVIIGIVCYRALARGEVPFNSNVFHVVFSAYIVMSAISLFNASNMTLAASRLVQVMFLLVVFSAANAFLPLARTVTVLATVTTIACAVALIHFLLPDTSEFSGIALQLSKISTFGNQTYFSGFLVLMFPVVLAKLMLSRDGALRRGVLIVLLGAMAYLLIVTESRSAWMAALVAVTIFLWLNFTTSAARRTSLIVGLAGAVLLFVSFRETILHRLAATFAMDPTSSVIRRLFFYEAAWKAFLHSPFIGNGLGNFIVFLPRFRSPDYWIFRSEDIVPHAHNEFLEILSETGLLGFVPFCLLMVLFFRFSLRSIATLTGHERTLMIGLFSSILGVLIDNVASMNLQTIPVMCCFWLLFGLAVRQQSVHFSSILWRLPPRFKRLRFVPFGIVLMAGVFYLPGLYDRYTIERDYLSGFLLRYETQYDSAASRFRNVLAHDHHHPEAHLYLAAILIQQARYGEAIAHLDSLLLDYPSYPKARALLAISHLEVGDTSRALSAMTAELALEQTPQTLYYASLIHRRLNHQRTEASFLTEVLSQDVRSGRSEFAAAALQRLRELGLPTAEDDRAVAVLRELQRKFVGDDSLQVRIRELLLGREVDARDTTQDNYD